VLADPLDRVDKLSQIVGDVAADGRRGRVVVPTPETGRQHALAGRASAFGLVVLEPSR
jgi:hypothetical protein